MLELLLYFALVFIRCILVNWVIYYIHRVYVFLKTLKKTKCVNSFVCIDIHYTMNSTQWGNSEKTDPSLQRLTGKVRSWNRCHQINSQSPSQVSSQPAILMTTATYLQSFSIACAKQLCCLLLMPNTAMLSKFLTLCSQFLSSETGIILLYKGVPAMGGILVLY